MTSKARNILIVAVFAIVGILIAFTFFIKSYLTPERISAFLIPTAEKALNRKVTVGSIDISLFKGITIRDFTIKETDESSDFFSCEEFILKYKLIPLLSKKVIIDELRLISPAMSLNRNKDGQFNFEGIGSKKIPVKEVNDSTEAKPKGLPVSLLMNNILIKNADVSLTDYQREIPDFNGSADINMKVRSTGGKKISSTGTVELVLHEVTLRKPSEKKINNLRGSAKYDVTVDSETLDFDIKKADLTLLGISGSSSGKILHIRTSPEIDLFVSLPKVEIAAIQKSLAPFKKIDGISLAGNFVADLRVSGMPEKIDSIQVDGSAKMENIEIDYQGMKALVNGTLTFKGRSIDVDAVGAVGNNSIEIAGAVKNYLKEQQIHLNLTSKQLNLDDMFPAGKPAGEQRSTSPPATTDTGAKPPDMKIAADGEIKVQNARYKNLDMNNLYVLYRFKNNILSISPLSFQAGKGAVNLKSSVNMLIPGYRYSFSGSIDSVRAEEIVNSFFPKARDTIFGALTVQFQMTGAGTTKEGIEKTLTGDGEFSLIGGKLANSKIPENLSLFLGVPELRTINLKEAEGKVSIKSGSALLKSVFSSDDLFMNPSGTIGLDSTINLTFDFKMSPQLTKKVTLNSGIAAYIKDDKGWGTIPLKLSGTFSNPSYGVDIERAGKRVIEKKGREMLDKFLDKQKDKKSDDKKEQPESRPVEQLFKGLFK